MATEVFCDAEFDYAGMKVIQPVLDGRTVAADEIPFTECGFERIDHKSAVTDWTDTSALDSVGRDEFGELARAFTGCDAAAVYPVISRNPATAKDEKDYAPILSVHSDYTHDYKPMVTEDGRAYENFLLPALTRYGLTKQSLRSASRLMMLQLWRNVGPERPDYPLALCDARDVTDPRRRIAILIPEYGGERLDFEAYAFFPPHDGQTDRWYTFPSLRTNEAVLLRTYDSDRAAADLPFWTPHSAFRDPTVPAGVETRRASIELRALCVWN
jgi:hypothetical protein